MAAVSKAVGCICIAALCLSLLLRVSADEAASDDGAHFHRLHLKPGILGVPPRDLLTWHGLKSAVAEAWDIFGPGGRLHPAYFLAHKGHLVVEGLLLVVIGYLFLQQAFKPHPRSEEPLTEKVSICSLYRSQLQQEVQWGWRASEASRGWLAHAGS